MKYHGYPSFALWSSSGEPLISWEKFT